MTFTEKYLRTRPPVEVGGRSIKRYHVTPGPEAVEPDVEQAALAILPRLLPEADGTPPATFVVIHRSRGDNAAYLNAYSWVWDNVLHFRGAAAAQAELGCPDADPTHFVVLDGRSGSAASGSCRPSPTSATPGSGTCSCPTSRTSRPTWPIPCRTA